MPTLAAKVRKQKYHMIDTYMDYLIKYEKMKGKYHMDDLMGEINTISGEYITYIILESAHKMEKEKRRKKDKERRDAKKKESFK